MPGKPASRSVLAASCTRAFVATSIPSPKRSSNASSANGSTRKSAIAFASPGSLRSAFPAQVREQLVARFRQVMMRGSMSPHRAGPRGIALAAGDHVHVQLAHDVAERTYVELVAFHGATQQLHRARDFAHQPRAIALGQAVKFDETLAPRDQHQPRE